MKTVVLDNKPGPDEPPEESHAREMLKKSPGAFMKEMASLEREYNRRLMQWEAHEKEEKARKRMEEKNTPLSDGAPDEGTQKSLDHCRRILQDLLNKLPDEPEGTNDQA